MQLRFTPPLPQPAHASTSNAIMPGRTSMTRTTAARSLNECSRWEGVEGTGGELDCCPADSCRGRDEVGAEAVAIRVSAGKVRALHARSYSFCSSSKQNGRIVASAAAAASVKVTSPLMATVGGTARENACAWHASRDHVPLGIQRPTLKPQKTYFEQSGDARGRAAATGNRHGAMLKVFSRQLHLERIKNTNQSVSSMIPSVRELKSIAHNLFPAPSSNFAS